MQIQQLPLSFSSRFKSFSPFGFSSSFSTFEPFLTSLLIQKSQYIYKFKLLPIWRWSLHPIFEWCFSFKASRSSILTFEINRFLYPPWRKLALITTRILHSLHPLFLLTLSKIKRWNCHFFNARFCYTHEPTYSL